MIEGIHVDVKSNELLDLLMERHKTHREKAIAYENKVNELTVSGLDEDMNLSGDPIAGLKNKVKTHKERAGFFLFLAEHIIPSETYRLSLSDLTNVELLSRWY